tara:strand:+ start:20977 stop:21444 length:468 start_codon:yes stop_codon:yes gene_type:complete
MAENNLTSNTNLLSPVGFKLTINRQKYANTEYFITNFSLPEITAGEVQLNFRGGIAFQTSESRQFGGLTVRFAIDEDMKNYTEIYDWLKQNTTEHEDADMILSVMTSHNTVNKEFQFKNAFPTSLSGVDFNVQANDVEYAQAEVSFRYDEFVIIK